MQKTFVVLPGNRILGPRQIKSDRAVFQHDRSHRFPEKILYRARKCVWRHVSIL
jgi:hypothetical protein